jgi:hypothetical protein
MGLAGVGVVVGGEAGGEGPPFLGRTRASAVVRSGRVRSYIRVAVNRDGFRDGQKLQRWYQMKPLPTHRKRAG